MPDSKILVVDDDEALLRVISLSLFLEDDCSVETARDGIEALERVTSDTFDLVILDLSMPRMDGRTFFRELRARGHRMPVVILSAYGAESARQELEAEAAISKPFDPDLLLEKIKPLLSQRGA